MFGQDAKIIQRVAPLIERVVIVDPQPASARFIAERMRDLCRPETWIVDTNERALKLAAKVDPQLIFAELSEGKVDGVDLTRRLRRSDLGCRRAPVLLVTGQPTAAAILAARDAGVHEFLRKPFTMKDLIRRLEAATLRPRDWIEGVDYVGPDRRRFNSGEYHGPFKRQADQAPTTEQARIGQALKILRSAISALERDPAQAMRALQAQLVELDVCSSCLADSRLSLAAKDMHRFVFETTSAGRRLDPVETERRAAPLLAFLPQFAEQRAAA